MTSIAPQQLARVKGHEESNEGVVERLLRSRAHDGNIAFKNGSTLSGNVFQDPSIGNRMWSIATAEAKMARRVELGYVRVSKSPVCAAVCTLKMYCSLTCAVSKWLIPSSRALHEGERIKRGQHNASTCQDNRSSITSYRPVNPG